ncbi:hypothetical protein BV25DRAFT_1832385 [Artomyces pyxidatus]|uniref:Uncharacterized protein n=1 Tax=Artomyces pyxidatus TaxID=48021 RepID=A0ACB8SJD1_9AGAM|nr:hypothetical protein BV25DRAFT_1832385 [Artomyces pyxidatus]
MSFIRTSLVLIAISIPALAIPAPYTISPTGRPYVGITPAERAKPSPVKRAKPSFIKRAKPSPVKRAKPSPVKRAKASPVSPRGIHVASFRMGHGIVARTTQTPRPAIPKRAHPSVARRQVNVPATVQAVTVDMFTAGPTELIKGLTSSNPTATLSSLPTPAFASVTSIAVLSALPASVPTDIVMAPSSNRTDPVVHHPELEAGGPTLHKDKVAAIAAILSVIVGLMVLVAIVKLTSNALRRRRYPMYAERLGSEDGLLPKSDMANEKYNFVLTRPDGSQMSPTLSSASSESPSPPHFNNMRRQVVSPPPKLALPALPVPPLPTQYTQLLSPTLNLVQQNLAPNRASTASGTLTASTTDTDLSETRSGSDGDNVAESTHRRMRSAPVSIAWSTRQSAASAAPSTGAAGEEGYWDSLDVCERPESTVSGRMSRTRSMEVVGARW